LAQLLTEPIALREVALSSENNALKTVVPSREWLKFGVV
jgi:hypothetical protein